MNLEGRKTEDAMENRIDLYLKRELKRAARHKEPLSIILIECYIENEVYRKSRFLPVFKQLANLIRKIIRDEDYEIIFGRQILLILPETFPDGARTVASKIIKKVKTVTFKDVEDLSDFKLHLVFGHANFPEDGDDRLKLLEHAKKSLEKEKEKLMLKIKEEHTVQ